MTYCLLNWGARYTKKDGISGNLEDDDGHALREGFEVLLVGNNM